MFDRIIVSTDENPMFLQFVPTVAKAWKKYFPEKKLSIAFISNKTYDDKLVIEMQEYAEVKIYNAIPGIPVANQAKISRHILASEYKGDICMIEDIDTIPLQRHYFENRTSKFEGGVLAVGHEVLSPTVDTGKFPMSTMTASGETFKQILNPNNLEYVELIKSFDNLGVHDNRESISNRPEDFSDESLIRYLLNIWGGPITKVNRNVDIKIDWLDRSWWNIDINRLKNDD